MGMEYQNGVRITKYHYEMTPLEAAIERYESLAKQHYSLKSNSSNLPESEKQLKLQESLNHLESERRHLHTVADVQMQLEHYRIKGAEAAKPGKGRREAISMLQNEDHHPTATLGEYMRAEAVPKPTPQHTAHHILPGSGQYRKDLIFLARIHMHSKGVRINDPANGVYLLHKDEYTPHWSMPQSRGHLKYHTAEYETLVSNRVSAGISEDHIKTTLQVIGRILQDNEPKAAFNEIKKTDFSHE